MHRAERLITCALAGCALGASAGTIVEHFFLPSLDGPLVGAVAGVVALGWLMRRAERKKASASGAVSAAPEPFVPAPEPFIGLVNLPLLVGGVAFVVGSVAERVVDPSSWRPILAPALAAASFVAVLLFEQVIRRKPKEHATAAAELPATRQYLVLQCLAGGAAATAIGGTVGVLLKHVLGSQADLDLYVMAAAFLLYCVWIATYLRRKRGQFSGDSGPLLNPDG